LSALKNLPRNESKNKKTNSPAWFAIIGATVLCISSDRLDVEELMHLVEWDMLIFFAALFCMVEGAIEVGLIDMIGGFLAGIIRAAPPEARRIVAIQILLWLSTIISGECARKIWSCSLVGGDAVAEAGRERHNKNKSPAPKQKHEPKLASLTPRPGLAPAPPSPKKQQHQQRAALLDNVPCTLVMVPVIEYLAANNLGLPLPLLAWALAFGACYGGNGTLIGASANIVGSSILDRSGYPMGYLRWLRWGVPVTLASVVVANAYMLLRYCLPGSTEYPPTPIL